MIIKLETDIKRKAKEVEKHLQTKGTCEHKKNSERKKKHKNDKEEKEKWIR